MNNNDSDSEYEIKQTIGKGNFGKVLLGISKKTGKKVAIKIIDKLKMNKFYNTEQIKREINVIQQMDHLNIIKIYKIENEFEKYKIIMEYCEKGELYEYIVNKRRLKEEESAYFYFQLINGLEFIHSKNIVHRDLKPENLLITKNKILKIIDFGLCNYHDINQLLSTPCGSPSYASPEMVSGHKYNGVMVDIWCTGIILFAMLSGYLPFEGKDNIELFKKIIKCEIKYPNDISENALDLMKKILVSDPTKRINIYNIKKHPFYLEGKKIFEKTQKNHLEHLNKKISAGNLRYNDGEFTERRIEKKKHILSKRKHFDIKKKPYIKIFENINLKNRKSIGSPMKRNILCFNITIENNNEKKHFDEENYFFKEKIFKKKNIFNRRKNSDKKKFCLTENNTEKTNENEEIKYIKPILSPKNRDRKVLINKRILYNSNKKENNINLKENYYNNLKKLINIKNYSPLSNSIRPYKRPTLKETNISLKKDNNNQRNTISTKSPINLDNLYINKTINLTERNSVIKKRIINIKNNNNNNLLNNSYVYKHKSFNKNSLKDDKYIYEKKHRGSKNYESENYNDNNKDNYNENNKDNYKESNNNNLNIYYTLTTPQTTTKQKNYKNNILFLPNINKKINENQDKNLYNNFKDKLYKKNINQRNNNQRNDNDFINAHYYGKTLDIQNNNNYIKKSIYILNKKNNIRKTANNSVNNKNEEYINNNNNTIIATSREMSKLLNFKKKILFKKQINDENNSIKNSTIIKSLNKANNNGNLLQNKKNEIVNLLKKRKIRTLIFNNQINQLNIYKNDNIINQNDLDNIYIYNNSHILQDQQNEIEISKPEKVKQLFNTIKINKRYQTENKDNDYQTIASNKNNISRKIYSKIENKNKNKNNIKISINENNKSKKGILTNSLFDNEDIKTNKKKIMNKTNNNSLKNINNQINNHNNQKKLILNGDKSLPNFIKSDINKRRKKNI